MERRNWRATCEIGIPEENEYKIIKEISARHVVVVVVVVVVVIVEGVIVVVEYGRNIYLEEVGEEERN